MKIIIILKEKIIKKKTFYPDNNKIFQKTFCKESVDSMPGKKEEPLKDSDALGTAKLPSIGEDGLSSDPVGGATGP